MSRTRPATDALEAQLAARLIDTLSAAQPALAPDISERLRFARQAAVERARLRRATAVQQTAPVAVTRPRLALGGATSGLDSGAPWPWWQRAMGLLPIVVLTAGLIGIDQWATQERIAVAADIDLELLADDLPPEAYADPGFAEFLLEEPHDRSP